MPNLAPKAMADNLVGKVKHVCRQAIAVALGKMTGDTFEQLELFKI